MKGTLQDQIGGDEMLRQSLSRGSLWSMSAAGVASRWLLSIAIVAMVAIALQGCGGQSSKAGARKTADLVMKSLLSGNISDVATHYALDYRPNTWNDVWNDVGGTDDASPCQNVSSQAVERNASLNGVNVAEITYTFKSPCVKQVIDFLDPPRVGGYYATIAIELSDETGDWTVTRIRLDNFQRAAAKVAPRTNDQQTISIETPTQVATDVAEVLANHAQLSIAGASEKEINSIELREEGFNDHS